jgi:hypothetical protein
MSTDGAAAANVSGATSVGVATSSPSGASSVLPESRTALIARRWRRAAFFLTGAAQWITLASLTYLLHPAITWAPLLLATAPVLLAAVAAFAPRSLGRWAVIAAIAVIIAGGAGWITHTSWLFAPALVALVVVALQLWRSPAATHGR